MERFKKWLLLVFFSCQVMSNFSWHHGLQHARLPCLSPTPGVCPCSCPLMPSNHLVICCPLLLPSIFPSIRVFSNELAVCIRWPKYWSFSFSISPSNEYSGLIPLGMTGLISLQSKGLSSLLQHHNSEASILWHSAFFLVQLSCLWVTTRCY